jgi:beta-glucanase (GH16 family)
MTYYNEVTVEQSVPGSYFCVCGFKNGYFGIQELSPSRKVVLFSVWDPGDQNNPDSVPEERRVKVLYGGENVAISRFGNEGTGGKSMFDYDWKIGQRIRCLVKATIEGNRTTYAAFFWLPETEEWKHLATFETITGGEPLSGYYSFVEDFRRNGVSAGQIRRARFGNGWVQSIDGQWIALGKATFTADNNPAMHINSGTAEGGFFLQTGGQTQNETALHTKLTCPTESFVRPEDPQWQLSWSDEFEGTGLADSKKWDYEEGFVRNKESQYYTRARLENARQEDGCLIIESHKEDYNNGHYTSASVITSGKQSFLYGRIEVRAQLPTGKGTWPAIWMLGDSIRQVGWPACGEIDIMENVGYDPYIIHANIHTKSYNHVKQTGKGSKIRAEKPWDTFHLYALEWYEDRLDFYFDNHKYFSFQNEGTGSDVWPYDKPHYLILNTAIGGAWGGQQGIDDSIFPQKFLIDYVRVYTQKK